MFGKVVGGAGVAAALTKKKREKFSINDEHKGFCVPLPKKKKRKKEKEERNHKINRKTTSTFYSSTRPYSMR